MKHFLIGFFIAITIVALLKQCAHAEDEDNIPLRGEFTSQDTIPTLNATVNQTQTFLNLYQWLWSAPRYHIYSIPELLGALGIPEDTPYTSLMLDTFTSHGCEITASERFPSGLFKYGAFKCGHHIAFTISYYGPSDIPVNDPNYRGL